MSAVVTSVVTRFGRVGGTAPHDGVEAVVAGYFLFTSLSLCLPFFPGLHLGVSQFHCSCDCFGMAVRVLFNMRVVLDDSTEDTFAICRVPDSVQNVFVPEQVQGIRPRGNGAPVFCNQQ
jgi:hypothetical protein